MKGKKKILLAVVLVLVMAVGITSIVVIRKRNKTVVKVFPVSMLNSSDWFDTDSALTGTLTSDYIQEVHLDSGQKVKKVYVKQGDKVKKGDVLLKYNVAEKELDLKLQKLQIQSSKMEISQMEKELNKLKNTKTVGSIDTGNTNVMDASVNLSAIKNASLGYLVARTDDSEANTGSSEIKSQNADTSADSSSTKAATGDTKASDSSEDSGQSSENNQASSSNNSDNSNNGESSDNNSTTGNTSGNGENSSSGNGTNSDSKKDPADGTTEKKEPTLVLKESISSEADKASGSGTKDDPLLFNLSKGAKVKGSFINRLISDKKYAEFNEYKADTDKKPISTFELTPDTKVDVSDDKSYTLAKLNDGGDSETEKLHDEISSVSQNAGGSGTSDDPYIYNLNVNGVVQSSILSELAKDKKYAKFVEYNKDGSKTGNSYTFHPDTLFKEDITAGGPYTISALNNLATKPAYSSLPDIIKSVDEKIDASTDSEYIYYLKEGGCIRGSVIKKLISDKINAQFVEFASEDDYKKGNGQNVLAITSDTKFDIDLSDAEPYSISYLMNHIKKNDSSSTTTETKGNTGTTTENTNPTTSTGKKIKFKQNRKKVQAGNGCLLTVVAEDGSSIDQSKVTWHLLDNISKLTKITRTKSGIWLYVDEGEPSSSVTITAQVTNISGISSEKISKTLIIKGADTSNIDDGNGGSGGSGSGSSGTDSDGTTDGTDSSGGDDSYTAEELKDAISDKEDEIAQAKEDLHDARISYSEAKSEVDKATVKAKISGTVTTAYSKGTLPTDGSAAIIVKAADGMYVKTSISEMDLDSVKVGGTINCTSSDTGEEYTAEIKEISDFPTGDASNDGGTSNPNSSYYPVVAFIKDADGLSPGGSVEVSYSSKSMGTVDAGAVYIQKAYVRTEDKKNYVYIKDKKTKRLKKQYVKVGKTVSGQYMEIKSGLTEDDYIAFPYGKNLREGVKTKVSEDDSEMIY